MESGSLMDSFTFYTKSRILGQALTEFDQSPLQLFKILKGHKGLINAPLSPFLSDVGQWMGGGKWMEVLKLKNLPLETSWFLGKKINH